MVLYSKNKFSLFPCHKTAYQESNLVISGYICSAVLRPSRVPVFEFQSQCSRTLKIRLAQLLVRHALDQGVPGSSPST